MSHFGATTVYHHMAEFGDPWRCKNCDRLPDAGEIVLMRNTAGVIELVECEECRPWNKETPRFEKSTIDFHA